MEEVSEHFRNGLGMEESMWQAEGTGDSNKYTKARKSGKGEELNKQYIKCIPYLAHARVGSGPIDCPKLFQKDVQEFLGDWDQKISNLEKQSPALEKDFDVNDAIPDNPEEKLKQLVEDTCTEIMNTEFDTKDISQARIDMALKTEIPSFEEMCQGFAEIQELYLSNQVYTLKDKRHDFLRLNAISRDMIQRKAQDIENEKGFEPIDPNDSILKVSIFDCRTNSLAQEFLMLSSQYLYELKDVIYCLPKQYYGTFFSTSGYFLIEDTFFDDLRTNGSEIEPVRYSDEIIEWTKKHQRYKLPGLSSYQQADMDIKLSELHMRLSSLYPFVHLGDCKHVIAFQQMRCQAPEDIKNRKAYPLLVYEPKVKRRKCGVCEVFAAKKVVYGDNKTPQNPFFFCDKCFEQFHCDSDGNLLYHDFQLFNYFHE